MSMLITQKTVAFQIPEQYLKDIMALLESRALETKNDKVILHFDQIGLKIIESPNKFIVPRLT